jgi:hypothetical protein
MPDDDYDLPGENLQVIIFLTEIAEDLYLNIQIRTKE